MRYAADDNLDKAKTDITFAIDALSEIVAVRCDGWDTFTKSYMKIIRNSYAQLIKIRDELDQMTEPTEN